MTALAMIIGMIPMALGLGEAGEQNAPLGRAVIGGLVVATFATLFLVPIFYTLLRQQAAGAAHARSTICRRSSRRIDWRSRSWLVRKTRARPSSTCSGIARSSRSRQWRCIYFHFVAQSGDRGGARGEGGGRRPRPAHRGGDDDGRTDDAHHQAARRRALRRDDDALLEGGRLSEDDARRQGRQGRGRADRGRDRVARARSAIRRRRRPTSSTSGATWRASRGSTRRATRRRSRCYRRRPTRRWQRTTSPCWRPTSRIRPCGRPSPAA